MTPFGVVVNAHDQLPSGATLTDLRDRAVQYGTNQAPIEGTDLSVLLNTIAELRDMYEGVLRGANH